MRKRNESHPEAIAYSVNEAAARLAVGRSTIYQLIEQGAIRAARFGRRTVVPASEIARALAERMEAAA